MINGEVVDSSNYKFFVGLYNDEEKRVSESGVLIDSHWILTSTHMLNYNRPEDTMKIATCPYEDGVITRFETLSSIEKIVPMPKFNIPTTGGNIEAEPDISLVKSTQRLDVGGAEILPLLQLYTRDH
ncbi:trypsin-like serine protease [Vibrio paucivorans]|uniref:S1 family peptidase n=1 Tax=Vibrio paucivorans TaxID=2829489 RepID=A0A9X3CH56_9VIBR|nr:trypsin-like serine protease [Vibrio paucivorans]MCW8335768.1 S1 family peptidase [Vibrio paucivorans]